MESKQIKIERNYQLCGVVGVTACTRNRLINNIFRLSSGFSTSTVNLIGIPAVISAKEDPMVAQVYRDATIAAIDGQPIVVLSRLHGLKSERCAAPDIMPLIFCKSIEEGKSHFFYGGKDEETLDKLKKNIEKEYPGINIKGMYSPPFRELTPDEDEKIVERINSLKPDFLWVGIGAPKQELWMWRHKEKIHDTVMLGVGAGFDFYAGTLKKAPKWMEKLCLEWLYRLIREPKRLWRRYLMGFVKFVYYSIEYKLMSKHGCVGVSHITKRQMK